jgi:IS5 family transposase
MSERISTDESFVDFFVKQRPFKASFLDDIDRMIDWEPIDRLLKKHYKKRFSADGRPAYPPLPLFKMLLLQRWYNLSDPSLESAVNDRLSFLRFAGFSFDSPIPDETTICRFRNELLSSGLHDKLFKKLTDALERSGVLVKSGAIVDASLIGSSRRPRKVVEVMPEDRHEDEAADTDTATYGPSHKVAYSDDTEASWVKKGDKAHYGYKLHMAAEVKDGFILGGHITPANHSDTGELERVVEEAGLRKGSVVLADKGYCSKKNRDGLEDAGYREGIMRRASRGNPLSVGQQERNKAISKHRYKVEQCFGVLKRNYQFVRSRYVGLAKVELEFYLNAMAFNLKKAVAMVT